MRLQRLVSIPGPILVIASSKSPELHSFREFLRVKFDHWRLEKGSAGEVAEASYVAA